MKRAEEINFMAISNIHDLMKTRGKKLNTGKTLPHSLSPPEGDRTFSPASGRTPSSLPLPSTSLTKPARRHLFFPRVMEGGSWPFLSLVAVLFRRPWSRSPGVYARGAVSWRAPVAAGLGAMALDALVRAQMGSSRPGHYCG
jgi:hypothetical protein